MRRSVLRLGLCVTLACGATACSRRTVDLTGRPCDGGNCLAGYTCDVAVNRCVASFEACSDEGRHIPCTYRASSCADGCRVCTGGAWSACEVPADPPNCVAGTISCGDEFHLTECGAVGYIDRTTACDFGCNSAANPPRCNDCVPGTSQCLGVLFVDCSTDGRVLSQTSCQGEGQCANVGRCDNEQGCQTLTQSDDGTPCDEGVARDGDMCNSACVDGECIAGAQIDCDDHLTCTSDRCATTGGCRHDALPSTEICRAAVGPCDLAESCNGTASNCPPDAIASLGSTCSVAADICDLPDHCDGVTTDCPDTEGLGNDVLCDTACVTGDYVEHTCQGHQCVASLPVACADACACSNDTCADGADACSADFSSCTFAFASPFTNATHKSLAQLTLNADCAGQVDNVMCTTDASARLCIYYEDFEAGLGSFTGTGISSADCVNGLGLSPDGIPFDGVVASNNCSGKVLRFAGSTTVTADAQLQPASSVSAAGLTGVALHLKAGFNPGTYDYYGENIHLYACCGATAPCTAAATVYNLGHLTYVPAGPGSDTCGEQPCTDSVCARSGYALSNAFDGCSDVRVRMTFYSSYSASPAAADNFGMSAVGTHTLPVAPAAGGNYTVTLRPCNVGVTQDIDITCQWNRPGTSPLTANTTVHVDP